MSILDKYGLTEDQQKRMIDDGVISTKYIGHGDVIAAVKKFKNEGAAAEDAVLKAAAKFNISRSMVYYILAKYK